VKIMRIWYLFLIAVTIVGFVLVFMGYNTLVEGDDTQQAHSLMMYGAIVLGFVFAVVALYFMRWSQNWWNR
jgi:uncharacterized membrane protein